MENNQPILVKRVKKVAGGHHGGAWKIAFADFATAMMAFFLVMWLMSSATPEQKKAISGYFQDPIGFTESASPYVIDLGGSPTVSPDRTLNPEVQGQPSSEEVHIDPQADDAQKDQGSMDEQLAESISEKVERERLEMLLQELQNKVEENQELKKFKDQILFEITQDGLRIQIMDAENRPMFRLGSAQLEPYFEDILQSMAEVIKAVPNNLSISGHTDAKPFAEGAEFTNWELSANRANAARRVLVFSGVDESKIARVVGYASSALFDREDPFDPVNRRIDIVVLTKKAHRLLSGQGAGDESPEGAPAADAGAVPDDQAEPLGADQVQEKLNVFDNGALQFDQPKE